MTLSYVGDEIRSDYCGRIVCREVQRYKVRPRGEEMDKLVSYRVPATCCWNVRVLLLDTVFFS